jgi:1-deoxy-D-xylulose-5-phosphate synthase
LGLPDQFIEHGNQEILRTKYDLGSAGIARRIKAAFPELAVKNPIAQSKL